MGAISTARMPAQAGRNWLALGAVAGPILFIVASFALAPTQPGYSVVTRPVSALAIGPHGEYMRAAFLIDGLLVTAGVIAIFSRLGTQFGAVSRWIAPGLLLISPLGVLWAGIFTMDRLDLHNIGAQMALATPVVTFPVVGLLLRRAPRWRRFGTLLMLGGPFTILLLVGFRTSVPLAELRSGMGGGLMGLWQRALGIEVLGWFVALGWLGSSRVVQG